MTLPTTPGEAAAFAARVRGLRAALLDEVADGTLTPAGVFARLDAAIAPGTDPDSPAVVAVAGLRLLGVLEARPGAGKVASRRLMAGLGLDELVVLEAVPAEARDALAAVDG